MRRNQNLIKLKSNRSEIASGRHNIKCFSTNARSLLSKLKIEELRIYAQDEKLDFLGIDEMWLHDTVENNGIPIEGYSLYRRDRAEIKSGKGEGVALYVREILSSSACLELNKYHTESV